MSYRRKHIKNKIQRFASRKPFFTKAWFWICFFVALLVVAGVYFILFYPGLQVTNISVFGNQAVKTSAIEDIVKTNINIGLINFFTVKLNSKSILLVDEEKVSQEISKQLPIIERITISKNWPQTLNVNVVERNPVGIYCHSQDGSNCYFIDKNGVIFFAQGARLPSGQGLASGWEGDFPIVRQTANEGQIFLGKKMVQDTIIQTIEKIDKNLKDKFKIKIQEVLISGPLKVDIKTSENWHIFLSINPDFNIELQITKLNLLLEGGMTIEEQKNLKYIDLRMKDRAIICDNSNCAK